MMSTFVAVLRVVFQAARLLLRLAMIITLCDRTCVSLTCSAGQFKTFLFAQEEESIEVDVDSAD